MLQDHDHWNEVRAELDTWKGVPVEDLIRHIMEKYHRDTRTGMADLESLSEEAALFEGWHAPVLLAIRDEVELFCTEMRTHLRMEESTLFPAFLAKAGGREVDEQFELLDPMELFEDEHDAAEGLLVRIRKLTDSYQAPENAKPLQVALYAACHNLALSLRAHIYIENQVLFQTLK